MPNETWQSDFTHYRLTTPADDPGNDVEIISWLDDHARYALSVTAPCPGHRSDLTRGGSDRSHLPGRQVTRAGVDGLSNGTPDLSAQHT